MAGATPGLHSGAVGVKRYGRDPVNFLSDIMMVDVTFAPPSLATLTGAVSSAFVVAGAAFGDRVEVFPPPAYSTQGIIMNGFVDSANNVKISLFNPTAGTVSLASGTYTIQVVRK